MPRTIDSIIASREAAAARRAAGLPAWDRAVHLGDVFRDEDMPFEQRRAAIVARLRATGWQATTSLPPP